MFLRYIIYYSVFSLRRAPETKFPQFVDAAACLRYKRNIILIKIILAFRRQIQYDASWNTKAFI